MFETDAFRLVYDAGHHLVGLEYHGARLPVPVSIDYEVGFFASTLTLRFGNVGITDGYREVEGTLVMDADGHALQSPPRMIEAPR